jgi:hypothetical protein
MARRALATPAGASAFLGGDGLAERLRAVARARPPRPRLAVALAVAVGALVLPLAAAVVGPTPAERERAEADAAVRALLPHRAGDGCLRLRYAVMRSAAVADPSPRAP